MASKTVPVMDAPVSAAPRRGRPAKNPDAPQAESSARSKALKAAKDAVKNLGPNGPTADVVIVKSETATLSGWGLIMGDYQWGEASYDVKVNGEHLGTFT